MVLRRIAAHRAPVFNAAAMLMSRATQTSATVASGLFLATHEMVWIPGRRFRMGSDDHYPDERPAHDVDVDGFWIDRAPVTNASFAEFVAATGYVTLAELAPNAEDYPGAIPEMLRAGSLVFMKPRGAVSLASHSAWWRWIFGADWRHPSGPHSSIDGLELHPVVHVAYEDVEAFARWAGKALPTEAEWELASRGGLDGAPYAWGSEPTPEGVFMANYWQGQFPHENLRLDGWEGTSPIGAYEANGYGLYDMIGNVWEWTCDWYAERHATAMKSCCAPRNPRGAAEEASYDRSLPEFRIPRKVLKGGSYLCADSYCRRYRPAARHPQSIDTSTSHIGFRCVARRDDVLPITRSQQLAS